MNRPLSRFAKYAWFVLAYTIAVVLWGAYVRATGSGAGCGQHWPLCNGQVLPRAPQIETLVEFSHRLTSGLAGIFVLIMLLWAFSAYEKGHVVRRGAVLSTIFIIIEGLIGAGLVLFELVAYNQSLARVFAVSAHLINTFILIAFMALTAWWASGGAPVRLRGQGNILWVLGVAYAGMFILGVSGAITALGDTLFPAGSLAEGIRQDFAPTAHFLVRLRVWHPVVAVVVGLYLAIIAGIYHHKFHSPPIRRLTRALQLTYITQLIAGFINVLLLAPVWMQMLHLLLADILWILLILTSASLLTADAPQSTAATAASYASGD